MIKDLSKSELLAEVKRLHLQITELQRGKLVISTYTMNEGEKVGMGNIDLSGHTFITCRYRREYLETALKCLKTIGVEYVDVIYKEDFPLMFGNINKKKTKASGVFVAPVNQ
jgi:hypothetical protein